MKPKSNEIATAAAKSGWTFLSNHAHVLLCIARDPELTMNEIAQLVGITERAVQRIVADLVKEEYLKRTRQGRRNRYAISSHKPLRHPIEAHRNIDAILELVLTNAERARIIQADDS
jgi:DNA-binding MarR family transcriptional regulator